MRKEDGELALLAQQGDTKAEETLIERYKFLVRIKAKIYYIIGADKEDVIQEGMIGLFKAIKTFDKEKASFATYASTCVNGQLINAIKKANRLKNKALNESISLEANAEDNDKTKENIEKAFISRNTPETMLLLKELIAHANKEKDNWFSDFEKKVWNLMQEGNSNSEIAKKINKPVKSIDNAVQRIKQKVYSFLQE